MDTTTPLPSLPHFTLLAQQNLLLSEPMGVEKSLHKMKNETHSIYLHLLLQAFDSTYEENA